MSHAYDGNFMDYAAQSSAHSAKCVTKFLSEKLPVSSVLDVGCAQGTWLDNWKRHGVADILGLDGPYVDTGRLAIPASSFKPVDLNRPFDLGRQFDLVQSLEVGEHIRREASEDFAASIARHATRYVLFSAAPPGQGGEYHINEQPFEFWRAKFAKHGFATLDCVRPAIRHDQRISYWYRYNVFLYVRRQHLDALPADLRRTEVADNRGLADVSPFSFRLRKSLVRSLPPALQHNIARFKARLLRTGRF